MNIRVGWTALAAAALVSNAVASDVPIAADKLLVVDTTAVNGKAKIILVAKDALVSKGAGTDPAHISAVLDIAYDSAAGQFTMPEGSGWVSNDAGKAQYANPSAPGGGSIKGTQITTGKLVTTKAMGLGETPLDISTAPTGSVSIAYTVVNGAETTRMCAQFASCTHKAIAGGQGFKLLCKDGTGDAPCWAIPATTSTTATLPPTTTSTLVPTTTTTLCTDDDDDSYCVEADCNDSNASIHPGATETPGDGIDQDCDGSEVWPDIDFPEFTTNYLSNVVLYVDDPLGGAAGVWKIKFAAVQAGIQNIDGLNLEQWVGNHASLHEGRSRILAYSIQGGLEFPITWDSAQTPAVLLQASEGVFYINDGNQTPDPPGPHPTPIVLAGLGITTSVLQANPNAVYSVYLDGTIQ